MDFHEPEKQTPLNLLSSNNWNFKHTRGLPVRRESKREREFRDGSSVRQFMEFFVLIIETGK